MADNKGNNMKFHAVAELFPLLDGDSFERLKADIAAHGIREPVVTFEGALIDGRNRWRAAQALGIDCPSRVYDGPASDLVSYVVSLNLHRRHLSESQRAMVAAKIANLGLGDNQHGGSANLQTLFEDSRTPPISTAAAAEMLNVSERSVATARKVRDEGAPELQSAVERGEASVSAAADIATLPKDEQAEIVARGEQEILQRAKEIRAGRAEKSREARLEKIAEISKGNADLDVSVRYPIIYADPPWRYENPPMGGTNRSIENHYPTMDLADICALPVSELATDDAMLYLWATAPKLAECLRVIEAWGFEYRTNIVWDKEVIGMGYHARNQHEILLIAKRGEIPPPQAGKQPSSVHRERRSDHSAKPEFYYEMIEAAYPNLPKIELFCRSPRAGWAVWGNQSGEKNVEAA